MRRFRLDRSVTLGMVQPALRLLGQPQRYRIPIVMYHGINNQIRVGHPYLEINTPPAMFARQMQLLSELGYKSIDLATAIRKIESKVTDEKSVVITFDDGLRDFYTNALQILQDHKFSATMFIPSNLIQSDSANFIGKQFMTWHEVREIESLGISIGSHTANHPRLYSLGTKEIGRELAGSKKRIEDELGKAIDSFSYPYAFPEQDAAFVNELRSLLILAGYRYGVTTVVGSANEMSDPYFMPRLPTNGYDDDRLFKAKLKGNYDWLHAPQLISKRIRGTRRIIGHQGDNHHELGEL
jgi:peptidoglycan/xylan/chitin deacetylase (PgdA/CDA1 family)